MAARRSFEPVDLYPRDGTLLLNDAENQAAELARVDSKNLAIVNSGMLAVKTAVEVALDEFKGSQNITVAHARQMYGQTINYLANSVSRTGVELVSFDSGDIGSTERVINKYQPQIVIAETIGNGPDVPILDLERLKQSVDSYDSKTVTILDNTLPLSTALSLAENVATDENVLIVESGTKSYTFNQELSGLIYSNNSQLMTRVRESRRTSGAMPGIGSLEKIKDLLPSSVEAFDERNRSIYRSTAVLAQSLASAESQSGDYLVSHPVLRDCSSRSDESLSQATPVFFLQCTGQDNQFELASRLWKNETVRKQAKIGQSFGFDKARILPDEYGPYVRIAGGAEIDSEALGQALKEAALNK